MIQIKLYKQSDDSRCGVACVQMILDYYKLPIPSEEEICKQLNHTYELGCTNEAICECLKLHGLDVELETECGIRSLEAWTNPVDKKLPQVPIIIDWMKQGVGHASVVVDVDNEYVTIADPEEDDFVKISHKQFMEQWYDWKEGLISKDNLVVRGMIVATNTKQANTNYIQVGKTIWELTKPQNGRDMHAKGFIEAVCEHGIGHHKGVHGCDGCCANCPKEIWKQVTED